MDGISQPAIDVDDKSVTPLPGQGKIRQGIALLGRDGDEKGANGRPSWTLDGSFLAFRYLPQLVPEFDDFLKKNPLPIAGLTAEQGSELLGARFVGRWKSGKQYLYSQMSFSPTSLLNSDRCSYRHHSYQR